MCGAGKQYVHENNYIDNEPSSRVSTGWFSYESGVMKLMNCRIIPKMSVLENSKMGQYNIQQEFLHKFKNALSSQGAPYKVLAETMQTCEPLIQFNNLVNQHKFDPEYLLSHAGHHIKDSSLISTKLFKCTNEGDIVHEGDHVHNFHSHRLACHGGDNGLDRKDVKKVAKLAQKWMCNYKNEKELKQKGQAIPTVEMNHYFRSKMPDYQILEKPNPEVVICPVTQRNLQTLSHFT